MKISLQAVLIPSPQSFCVRSIPRSAKVSDRALTQAELDANMARNIEWLTSKVKKGYTILDLGRDPVKVAAGKAISDFYQAELDILAKLGIPKFDISVLRPK